MKSIARHLREDYERSRIEIPEGEVFLRPLVSYDTVLRAHYLISDYFEASTGSSSLFGVKNMPLLLSAVSRQKTEFGGHIKWRTPLEKAATLFYGLVKNHAFHDGNKRTALLALIYQLYLAGRFVDDKKDKFEDLTVKVAANELSSYDRFAGFSEKSDAEVLFIADFIRRKTRKIEKQFYSLTYQEFDSRLRNFGFRLEDASGNYINVLKQYPKGAFKGFKWVKEMHWVKVHQIGFPGWKRQINLKAVKETLKACELTAEKGIDSAVFYHGAEPMYHFIQEFEGPLERLKDR